MSCPILLEQGSNFKLDVDVGIYLCVCGVFPHGLDAVFEQVVIGAVLDFVGFRDPVEKHGKVHHLRKVFFFFGFFWGFFSWKSSQLQKRSDFHSHFLFAFVKDVVRNDTYSRERAQFFQTVFKVKERRP